MTGICDGLRVLEMGSGSVAGAIAGMVLADAGARVIKIEPPEGDKLRRRNPSGFLVWNRGKESQVADLRTPEGQARLKELAATADVVIEAFAPGRTTAWGVDADTLCALNPALVHCSITGFGPTGPYADIKAQDSLIAAKSGLWSRGAFAHREGPIMYPVAWASFGAGMQAVAGILGALRVRDFTGRGQRLGATLWAGLEPLDYFVATIVQLASSAVRRRRPTRARRRPPAATECSCHQGRPLPPDLDVVAAPGPRPVRGRRDRGPARRPALRQPAVVRDARRSLRSGRTCCSRPSASTTSTTGRPSCSPARTSPSRSP